MPTVTGLNATVLLSAARNTPRRPPVSTTALVGTTSASLRSSVVTVTRAYMPGFSRKPGFGISISIGAVRVAGSSTGATRAIRPVNISPGNASTSTCVVVAGLELIEVLFDDVGDEPDAADVDDVDDRRVLADKRARIDGAAGDEAVDRRDDDRVLEVDAKLVEPRGRLVVLRAREIELRDRRLVARLGVVERLLRQQLPREQVARPLGVGLGELEVRFALPDGGARDLERRLLLLDLLLELEVFDLGDPLSARHAIAEADGDVLQPAGRARHDRDGGVADEIADDDQLLHDRAAVRGARSRRSSVGGSAAAEAAAAEVHRRPPPPSAGAAAAARGLGRPAPSAGSPREHARYTPRRPRARRSARPRSGQSFSSSFRRRRRRTDRHHRAWSAATATGVDRRNAAATSGGRFLHALEVDLRAAVVEQRAQFRVLRIAQIALRLDHEEVRGQADVEPALLGLEALLGQLPRRRAPPRSASAVLDLQRGVGDFGGDLQLERAQLRGRLAAAARARARRLASAALAPIG